MRNPTVLSLCVLSLAYSLAGSGAAQQPSRNSAHNAVKVMLPVTVRDKHGALVVGVRKSDLSLSEDGRPQTIESLTRDSSRPFRIGLLLDTTRGMNGALPEERKAAGEFIDRMLPAQGKNQLFLIHFDREVELLEDFTSAREKLHGELDDMGSTHPEKNENQGPETADDERPVRHGHDGTQLYDAIYLACDELMKGKDGRKALIVFSNGADHGSKETMNEAVDAADRAGVAIYTIFFKGERENEQPGFTTQNRRGGVGFPGGGGYPGGDEYPGGGNGRRTPEPRSATGIDGKKIMQEIADRTGGHAYEARKTADLEPIFKLIDEDLNGEYLLTYAPDKPDAEGGFHKIALTADNKDWKVSTREGYYAPER